MLTFASADAYLECPAGAEFDAFAGVVQRHNAVAAGVAHGEARAVERERELATAPAEAQVDALELRGRPRA